MAPASHTPVVVERHSTPDRSRSQETLPQEARALPEHCLPAENGPAAFDILDMQLLHHFVCDLSQMFADEGRSLRKWRVDIPKIGIDHPFVLHAILAVSALHLSRDMPHAERQRYKTRAADHCANTLPVMISALNDTSELDSSALFAAAMFLTLYHLALGPTPGQYLGYSDDGEAEWMWLFRGLRYISETARPELLKDWREDVSSSPRPVHPDDSNHSLLLESQKHIAKLRNHIVALRMESDHFDRYLTALDSLEESFVKTLDTRHKLASQEAIAWLYRMRPDFVTALQEKLPMALVIFAHFGVLLSRLEHIWYINGWSEHILTNIQSHLHLSYREWLTWPLLVLKPPTEGTPRVST